MRHRIAQGVGVLLFLISSTPVCMAQSERQVWVSFTAKVVQNYETKVSPTEATRVELRGVFARNGNGSEYSRLTQTKDVNFIPVGPTVDFADVYDRQKRSAYIIDFQHKTIQKGAFIRPGVTTEPITRLQFDAARKGETPLGRQTISGVDCEGFRVPAPKFKKQDDETWYAPSLNFVVVRSTHHSEKRQLVTTQFEDIRVGVEPDPAIFRLPDGFKVVQ